MSATAMAEMAPATDPGLFAALQGQTAASEAKARVILEIAQFSLFLDRVALGLHADAPRGSERRQGRAEAA